MLDPVFDPFPVLHTARLSLRALVSEDAADILYLRSHPDVMRYFDRPVMTSLEEAGRYIDTILQNTSRNEGLAWAIVRLGSDRLIGTISLWKIEKDNHRADIGYMLHPEYQRQGLMGEAMTVVLRYGFDVVGLHSIVADINPGNAASRALLRRSGFRQEAYFRENLYFNDRFLDSEIWVILSSDRKNSCVSTAGI